MHNERGILVEDVLGPYNEGAELMLTCSVSGGKSDTLHMIHCFYKGHTQTMPAPYKH